MGFRLWAITQSIKPRLKLIEQQNSWLRFKHFKEQVDARHVGFCFAFSEPFSFDELTFRMAIKEDFPQELESLLVEAFSDDAEIGAELESLQLGRLSLVAQSANHLVTSAGSLIACQSAAIK